MREMQVLAFVPVKVEVKIGKLVIALLSPYTSEGRHHVLKDEGDHFLPPFLLILSLPLPPSLLP